MLRGLKFIFGEHNHIFKAIVDIYNEAKSMYGIVPVILAEEETKVKS